MMALRKDKTSERSIKRFFDLDKNGWLNTYEQNLIITHRHFGWKLADDKKKRLFDANNDWLLEPAEWDRYQKYKKARGKEKAFYLPGKTKVTDRGR